MAFFLEIGSLHGAEHPYVDEQDQFGTSIVLAVPSGDVDSFAVAHTWFGTGLERLCSYETLFTNVKKERWSQYLNDNFVSQRAYFRPLVHRSGTQLRISLRNGAGQLNAIL